MNSAKNILRKCLRVAAVAAVEMALCPTLGAATSQQNQSVAEEITVQLASKTTAADSLPLLLDLFDLSDISTRVPTATQVLETAQRAGDAVVQLDMLRNLATFASLKKDEDLARAYLNMARDLPETEDRKQTEVYIRSRLALSHSFQSEADRDAYLRQLISDFNNMDKESDEYERASKLLILVHVLQGSSQGTLITEYVEEFEKLLRTLPKTPTDYLRSGLYNTAAIVYWYNDMPQKSVEADKQLLKLIKDLTAHYQEVGRGYRNFDQQEYVSLRRMLRNYEVLTDEEFEQYYARVQELAARNADVARDMKRQPAVEAMRLLKDEKYAEALPLVKKLAEREDNINELRFNLRLLADVAEKAGDHNLALQTKARYADLLEDFIRFRSEERMRELQIIYDVNDLKQTANKSELERQHARTTFYIGAGAVLLVLLAIFVLLYLRFRRLISRIQSINNTLEHERATLLSSQRQLIQARDKLRQTEMEKSQLITYLGNELVVPLNAITQYTQMIIDAMPDDEENSYTQRFLAVVRANSRILQEIASDVQEFSLMENHTLSVNHTPLSANAIAEMAMDSIRPLSKPELDLIIEPTTEENDIVNTDGRRVVPAITALLTNAIKFTEEGSVTLKVDFNRQAGTVSYTVTDTGIGVPADKAEMIFERFSRLNPDRPGIGIGLNNCAMIARALGGSVRLDTTYPGPGARFILTIPIA